MAHLSLLVKAGHTVEIIRRLAPSFEEERGIELRIEVVTEDQAYDRLASGRDLPDVCTVPYWYLSEMVAAGTLTALNPDDYPGLSHPRALDALSSDGKVWAIPHTLTGGTLFTLKESAPMAPALPPQSFDDFLDKWDTVIARGSSVAIRAGSAFSSAETYRGLLHFAGVTSFTGAGRPDVSDMLGPLSAVVDRLRRQKEPLTSLDYAQMGDLFAQGRASVMFDTSAWATIYALDEAFSSRVSYGRLGQDPPAQFFYAEGLGIASACQNQEAAHSLLAWRHSPDVIREEVTTLNRIDFPRLDIREESWFSDLLDAGANHSVFREVLDSWDAIPANYPISGPGFVTWGRALMAAIADAVDGAELSDALTSHLRV